MSLDDSKYSKPIFKYFRGNWKELGVDDDDLPNIKTTEYYAKDLESKSIVELEEMIFRQEKILNNKAFISKLKDKGDKLRKKYELFQHALKVVKENTEKCHKAEEKNDLPKDTNFIEWQGHEREENNTESNLKNEISVDEDESNPLQLLARHSVEYPEKIHTQKFKLDENSPETIAKELERLNIEDAKEEEKQISETKKFSEEISSGNYFGKKLLDFENDKRKVKREKFKPFRSINAERNSTFTSVKGIPIAESLKLMADSHNKNHENYYKEAAGALRESTLKGMTLPSSNNWNYRDSNSSQHILEEFEDEEEYLELAEEEEETYE